MPFSRVPAHSTFYEDLKQSLLTLADESRIHPDYQPEVPNATAHPVDFMLEGGNGIPLFLYGIPDQDKARRVTLMLAHFHRHGIRFKSLLVFRDQTQIPEMDLARLSDVGGEMVSALESREAFGRKLRRHLAAA